MFGGKNNNPAVPLFLDDNGFQSPANASNQLQLFKNVPVGYNLNPMNYFGNENKNTKPCSTNKRGRETETATAAAAEDIPRKHKLHISNVETDHHLSIRNQNHHPVSTGLKLAYDDDERNSSITSANGSMTIMRSIVLSLSHDFRAEIEQQEEELTQFIKTQEEIVVKGIRDIKQRQTATLLNAIEKSLSKKLQDKDLELDNLNLKNHELVDKMRHLAADAQNWCYRSKYTESVINVLKANLHQAMLQQQQQQQQCFGDQKEGFGDSDLDDTGSCLGPDNNSGGPQCRGCGGKEACVLVMPCRHLCLCVECERVVSVCPVCRSIKSGSVEVCFA